MSMLGLPPAGRYLLLCLQLEVWCIRWNTAEGSVISCSGSPTFLDIVVSHEYAPSSIATDCQTFSRPIFSLNLPYVADYFNLQGEYLWSRMAQIWLFFQPLGSFRPPLGTFWSSISVLSLSSLIGTSRLILSVASRSILRCWSDQSRCVEASAAKPPDECIVQNIIQRKRERRVGEERKAADDCPRNLEFTKNRKWRSHTPDGSECNARNGEAKALGLALDRIFRKLLDSDRTYPHSGQDVNESTRRLAEQHTCEARREQGKQGKGGRLPASPHIRIWHPLKAPTISFSFMAEPKRNGNGRPGIAVVRRRGMRRMHCPYRAADDPITGRLDTKQVTLGKKLGAPGSFAILNTRKTSACCQKTNPFSAGKEKLTICKTNTITGGNYMAPVALSIRNQLQ
ncbi:hypothetical protein DFH08DRAFT_802344 [Mycena albidolilacea]|uniref:Uncharacterized protein n=1 Tax=Mycena albidolilacea TaxID=1033008 RepID=A0AAD7F0U9_9AGAR|nr:hypothetical protein DFH08DRAFT_802344 [Mycena albidolilacea]